MFKPHELIQAGSADVPLQSDAEHAAVAEDVRRPEVKFARVWQADDLFEGKAPAGGFVSQAAAQVSAKRFALRDLDSIFLIGPRSTDSAALPQPQDKPAQASADLAADDAPELAASSLANSVYIVTGMSLVMGLSSAMEPLCGQAYGAKNYKTLGDVLQRALLVCCMACLPVALLWSQSTALMVAAGQDPAIAEMAARCEGEV